MTHINKLLSTVCAVLFISFSSLGSNNKTFHPDTIRLQMPNGTTVECMNNYNGKNDLTGLIDINQQINDFLKRWAVLHTQDLKHGKALHIISSTKQEFYTDFENTITIKERPVETELSFPIDKPLALTRKGKHKLEFLQKEYGLAIYFNTLEQLQELKDYKFSEILSNTDKELHKTPNAYLDNGPFIAWLSVDDKNTTEMIHKRRFTEGAADNIILSAGTSLENVKGNWNGGIYASMTVQLGSKLIPKHAFKFEYEWMYDFSTSENKNINQWVSLGYARNLSSNPNKTNWLSMSVGYLAKQKGDLFEKDSFRIGVNKRIHRNVSLEPQLYFNDFFKGIHPGFKIKIHL